MSQRPIDRSPDLKRLRDEGYNLQVVEAYLVVWDIPYLAAKDEIKRGILVCVLSLANDIATPPGDHTANFIGAYPCHADGSQITQIVNSENNLKVSDELTTNFYLSAKPQPSGRYENFYDKVTTYVRLISGPAQEVDQDVTANTFTLVRDDEHDEIFNYFDTASSRADIVEVNRKMCLGRVAILGHGGTGGYILDYVAKVPVREIHLFDGDLFLQHNAFRAPGAPSGDELEKQPYKVDHFYDIYSKMRKGIVPHREFMSAENLHLLEGMNFVFISMEAGTVKKAVIEKLLQLNIPFVEVGMGVYLRNNVLGGLLRTTAATAKNSDHLWGRISLSDGGVKNEYDKNIQIAELNALHAAFAVIKWKKIFGFYDDRRGEHYSTYAIGRNDTNNEDAA
ncbi:ThiF family adenylyltransferase [Methylocapsa sp. D3K7]|uniref:ThiF family adenylyltransferase n=1 Tax=Methylocapsa sp. D3K7 TaxID=3041435 RepID=UPI00244EB0F7|nr:ThiF family adenylyltransferase [Methylocapsa sp. D3K7]WGJ15968.1 ThiF family adenylyltransferase [Methylocapsa sp. D3K7]